MNPKSRTLKGIFSRITRNIKYFWKSNWFRIRTMFAANAYFLSQNHLLRLHFREINVKLVTSSKKKTSSSAAGGTPPGEYHFFYSFYGSRAAVFSAPYGTNQNLENAVRKNPGRCGCWKILGGHVIPRLKHRNKRPSLEAR